MTRIFSALVLVLLFVPAVSIGQLLPQIQNFGPNEGFKDHNHITDVQAATDNNVYIHTIQGMYRFDGKSFHNIASHKQVKGSIYRFNENKQGIKYIVDASGQVFFIQGDSLAPFALNDTLSKRARNKLITDVYLDRSQSLHIAYKNGSYLTINRDHQIREILKEQHADFRGVACLLLDGDRPFIAYCRSKKSSTSQRHFYLMDEAGKVLDQQPIQKKVDFYQPSVTKLSNGNFLLAVFQNQLIEFDQKAIVQKIPYKEPITRLLTDAYGGLWISMNAKKGTHYYRGGIVDTSDREILFPGITGSVTTEDFQQGVWVFSREIGLNRIANPTYQNYSKRTGVFNKNALGGIAFDGQKIYVSDKDGQVVAFDPKARSKEIIGLPSQDLEVNDLHYDQKHQTLWIGGRDFVYYSKEKEGQNIAQFGGDSIVLDGMVRFYDQPHDSTASFAILAGSRYLLVRGSTTVRVSEKFPHRITAVLVTGDSTWVGTFQGLYLETPDSIINVSAQFPQIDAYITSMYYFNRRVWIGTSERGFFVWQGDHPQEILVHGKAIRTCFLLPRNKQELWANTPTDILKFSLEGEPNHFSGTHMQVFPPMPPSASRSKVIAPDAIYWLTIKEGVLQTDFDHMERKRRVNPALQMIDLRINGNSRMLSDTVFHLPHNENNIDISFLGIAFDDRTLRYRYRFGNSEESWTETDDPRFHFAALAPGDYTLEIQVTDLSVYLGAPKRLRFVIAPPFWERWWFLTLCGLVLVVVIYSATNYRNRILSREKDLTIKRLSAEQKVLRAKMDPHFVFNIVASLQYLVRSGENQKASLFLEKLSSIMRSTLEQTSKDFTTVDEEVQFLTDYMEMERLRLEGKFDFEIRVDDAVKRSGKIPNFLIQPLIENAIQHGIKSKRGKGKIELNLLAEKGFLKVQVTDDGVGYARSTEQKAQKERKRKSYGLETVEKRLQAHNGKGSPRVLQIEDLGNTDSGKTGTQVNVWIKWEN